MFQTKAVETKHILSSFSNRAVYVIMGKNTIRLGRPQMKIWRTRIACWMPKATNTHTQNM